MKNINYKITLNLKACLFHQRLNSTKWLTFNEIKRFIPKPYQSFQNHKHFIELNDVEIYSTPNLIHHEMHRLMYIIKNNFLKQILQSL